MSYLAAGDGSPILIVPAVEQTAEWWADVGYLDLLARNHRVVIVDPMGHGRSGFAEPADMGRPEPTVGALSALCEHEAFASATVWGFDGGGEYATVLARRRPDIAAKVVVAGMYLGDARQPFNEIRIDRRSVLDRLADALDAGDWAMFFDISPWLTNAAYQAEVRERNDPMALAMQLRAIRDRPGGFVLPGVATFAYWGEGQPFHRANVERVEAMPISWATLPGDRANVFAAASQVVDLVEGFLRPVNAAV